MNDTSGPAEPNDARLRAALRLTAPSGDATAGPNGSAHSTGSTDSASATSTTSAAKTGSGAFPPPPRSTAVDEELPADNTAWDIATTAHHLGVSAHTLRYYERIGLVRVGRSGSGHRRYDAAAVRRLVFLTRMRTSGMPIRDLRRYVDLVEEGEGTVPARLAILTEHRTRLHSRIDDLQLALAATDYKIALYSQDMDGTDGGATNPAKGPADADAASRRLRRGARP